MDVPWNSRRSPVYGLHGVAASTQPLVSGVGVEVLRKGGNAADAAVAMAAAINVLEPTSTGIGGDAFCLFYEAATKKVRGINGSGRSPAALSLELLHERGYSQDKPWPMFDALTVTVPGAAACWEDTVRTFGSGNVSLADLLQYGIEMAEEGVPISDCTAKLWASSRHQLQPESNVNELLVDGHTPAAGEVYTNKNLAATFRALASQGKKGFYEGRVAEAIVAVVKELGGVMELQDLSSHTSEEVEPISASFHGVDVHEIPPNGQGITALLALQILDGLPLEGLEHNGVQYLHYLIEALRLAFADAREYVADQSVASVPVSELLSASYAETRRALISPDRAAGNAMAGSPFASSDTVYFSVVDVHGNACSFINSNYMSFGSGIIPTGCGFTLQNRGYNFSLLPRHRNQVAPLKRPYHTIIPAMATRDGELLYCFGVMGGFMQPQGHVQVLLNMLLYNMSPQQALDMPRFCIGPGHTGCVGAVAFEEGISDESVRELIAKGHEVSQRGVSSHERALFGRGQIIRRGPAATPLANVHSSAVLCAGSDPRGDGCAIA
eukprot:TRINITY_DN5730_c0_g1_i1.p1 TRINITY_DN5730_c0_g1~~TRINITY_DN5730_c0_g1_i1.p1  ORF type:complete len:554 (-),score=142.64 TRINITY_DN5730_c0_g1_i1:40-1701(-)